MTKFKSLLNRFRRSQSGTTAVILAITAVPLMLAAGMGLDFIRASNLKTHMQNALDASALAAASSPSLSTGERIKLAEKAFAINWRHVSTIGMKANPVFVINKDKVTASASAQMQTSIMHLAGIDDIEISGSTTVNIPENKKAEIALVLDYSGSMTEVSGNQVKYVAMKKAAIRLVNDLKTSAPKRVKVGLVPFSQHVWLSLPKEFVRGQTGTGTWTGCTQDRLNPYSLRDTTPDTADDDTKWGQPNIEPGSVKGCADYVSKKLVVRPLTDDLASITTQLDEMRPRNLTNISLGAEIGWHLLSPNAPFMGVADYEDKGTDKVMVILTDGRQTMPAWAPGGSREPGVADPKSEVGMRYPQAEKNLVDICEGAKARGITIMTVAFDLRDDATRNRLRNCSSDPQKHFFVAEDSSELAQAFEEIKSQITASVFISN
jgi:Flp pilus assembly protein TadG